MKNIIIGLIVFLLLVVGLLYLSTNTNDPPTPTTSQPPVESPATTTEDSEPNTQVSTIPADSYLHAEPELQYTITLPHTVDVSSPQAGITRYRYVGPDSAADTEITDGYTVTIEAMSTTATSLEAVVARDSQGSRTIIEDTTSVQVVDEPALRYTTESALGNQTITNYAFLPGNGYAYVASINTSSADSSEYELETNEIINSLQFVTQEFAQNLAARTIPIAMLDYASVGGRYTRESDGPERGCDSVVLVEHIHDTDTITPLNASLEQLFAYDRDQVAGWQNFIASQNDTLTFERAEIVEGEARIYLTGELGSLGGVCDNPRTAIQIEETALAYDTVDSVQIYLNEEPTDLIPDGR